VAGIAAALTHARTPAGILTALLLLLPTMAFAAAPYNSLAARRASAFSSLEAVPGEVVEQATRVR
jgi:hypothetical protein